MKKKSLIVLASVCVVVLVAGGIIGWTTLGQRDQKDNELISAEMYEEIRGIPKINFESTKDREFDFCLYNNETKQKFEIDGDDLFGTIKYDFLENNIGKTHDALGVDFKYITEARSTSTIVETMEGDENSRFIFGVLNESLKAKNSKDCPVIYIEYSGDDEWSVCGIHTGMTYQNIIDELGEPSQEMGLDFGYAVDYYALRDDHTYMIHIVMDDKGGTVNNIVFSIDNYPVMGKSSLYD